MENTIKIATTGNVDSGKTTLTGVLVNKMFFILCYNRAGELRNQMLIHL